MHQYCSWETEKKMLSLGNFASLFHKFILCPAVDRWPFRFFSFYRRFVGRFRNIKGLDLTWKLLYNIFAPSHFLYLAKYLQGANVWILFIFRAVHVAGFLSDKYRIVSGADDYTSKVWDVSSASEIITYGEHTDYVRCGCTSKLNADVFVTGLWVQFILNRVK